jgi:hypothetical protein
MILSWRLKRQIYFEFIANKFLPIIEGFSTTWSLYETVKHSFIIKFISISTV